mmetsp:Transcript_24987/g.51896  ORF Transcript_24987/g.51896 Transcript_24987/m.51896 type:complete len:295 (+) Transcript_24987:68-952(+)
MLALHLTPLAARAASTPVRSWIRESTTEVVPHRVLLQSDLLSQLNTVFAANPFAAQNALSSMKCLVCDVMVQTQVEGRRLEDIDKRRAAVFMTFGSLYTGGVQYLVYTKVFPRLFTERVIAKFTNQPIKAKLRNKEGIKALLKQNMTDMIFNQPLLYFPAFYIVKEALTAADEVGTGAPGHYGSLPSLSSLPVSRVVSNALDKYRPNMVSDVATMSMFWFPANFICYSIPIHFRLPAIHAFSLAWTSGLSAVKAGDFNTTTQNINMQKTEGNHQRTPLDKGADRLNLAWTSMSN